MIKRKAQENLNSIKVVLSELFFGVSIGPINLSQRSLTVGDIEFPEKVEALRQGTQLFWK